MESRTMPIKEYVLLSEYDINNGITVADLIQRLNKLTKDAGIDKSKLSFRERPSGYNLITQLVVYERKDENRNS